ncbi:MAG: M48 family metalloprotease [Candidatus Eremiobacteraeota bacterium]|nr:M48 family metalloprotease [Candidatus Eremiobacteraeota bacterium]
MDPLRNFQPTGLTRNSGPAARSSEEETEEAPRDRFWDSPVLGEEMSLEEETAEGDRQEDELRQKYPEWPGGQPLLEKCHQRLTRFCTRSDVRYRFAALDTSRPLASSCANGMVFFSRGLLEHLTFDQVCYFVAHEIAHTELRHYATRMRRRSELQQAVPAAAGTALRMRLDQTAVVAVRHQEEFEADHQAALWLDLELAQQSLNALAALCQKLSPETLTMPSHPSFPERISRVKTGPPELLAYCYTLLS